MRTGICAQEAGEVAKYDRIWIKGVSVQIRLIYVICALLCGFDTFSYQGAVSVKFRLIFALLAFMAGIERVATGWGSACLCWSINKYNVKKQILEG